MIADPVDQELKDEVHEQLQEEWPSSVDLEVIANDLGRSREETRLALRELTRDGKVSQDAEWDYRATGPGE